MRNWLHQDYVAKYYDYEAWMNELEDRSSYSFISHFIVEEGGVPIGFCQYYDYSLGGESWHGDFDITGCYSIDYMIGNPSFLGRGYGVKIIKALCSEVFSKTSASCIIVQPEKDNHKSRGALVSSLFSYDEKNDIYFIRRYTEEV